ncbi:MAG TPA: hypothetical protein VF715_08975 [Thermoleophilaceae bacterium]
MAGARLVGAAALILAVAAALSAALMAPSARTADTEAPPGAGKNWLPNEDWVVRHWIPFEERQLYRELGVRKHEVFEWLDDYDHTIASLARRQGVDPSTLIARLIRPWKGSVSREQLTTLRSRTRRTMTQSHLSRHLLFHVFHNRHIGRNAESFFGVSHATWWKLRSSGHTVLEVARRGGRSERQVRRALLPFLERELRMGVKRNMTPRRQARAFLATQRKKLRTWMRENRLRVAEDEQH